MRRLHTDPIVHVTSADTERQVFQNQSDFGTHLFTTAIHHHTIMAVLFDPEGPVAQQLKPALITELRNKFGISDDAEDVAEFILVLIGSNKTAGEIVGEVRGLIDFPIDEGFVNTIFAEIERLLEGGQQPPQAPQQPPQPIAVPVQPVAAAAQPVAQTVPQTPAPGLGASISAFPDHFKAASGAPGGLKQDGKPHATFHPVLSFPANPTRTIPTGPRGKTIGGGVGKSRDYTSSNSTTAGRKSYALKNSANFEKALAINGQSAHAKSTTTTTHRNVPKGRCADFPYCTNKECPFAHPTKVCFQYPNCPNPPGTCNFLHPDQDQELMAKLEQTKREYQEKKRQQLQLQQQQHQQQWQPAITVCKFAHRCSKEKCPFGHPTPANENSVMGLLEWCQQGKGCQDASCLRAHPSPGSAGSSGDGSGGAGGPDLSINPLEQCKFGAACTNYKCPRRHATSVVLCRDGANCRRLDCFFSHPIDEACRFGAACTNKNCMFNHPEGRQVMQSNTWTKEGGSVGSVGVVGVTDRQFAVPDDQVMEHATQT